MPSKATKTAAATRRAGVSFLVFAAVALAALVVLYNTMAAGVDGETATYSATFTDVNGLRSGDDVRLAGVKVGDVTSIEVDGDVAVVGFTAVKGAVLRSDTGLVMRYQNLIGQRYLALLPGAGTGKILDPGTKIPVTQTSPGFDLTALLNGFRPLFQVLKPEDINTLSESIVKVLQGEGGTVASLLQETTDLTGYVVDQEELFHQTAENLTPVLQEISGDGVELGQTITSLEQLTQGLARDRLVFGRSVTDLAGLLARTDDTLTRARRPLARDIADLRAITRLYADYSDDYARSTPALARLLANLGRTTSYRSAVNIYLCDITIASGDVSIPTKAPVGKRSEVCQ